MTGIQFTGLGSGLDTQSIISQLMQVESIPQTNLKNRMTAQQGQVTALQTINSAFSSLKAAAASFASGSTWSQLSTSSSNPAVKVTASSAATPADLTVTVNATATSAKLSFATSHALTDVVADPSSSLTLSLPDGSSVSVATGDGTLTSVIAGLNALRDADGKPLVTASPVNLGNGQFRLLVTSTTTGSGGLDLAGAALDSGLGAVTSIAGSDASISIGAGLTLTSRTNTFTSVVPGVDVTLAAGTPAGESSVVQVYDDGASRATSVKAFVSQLNDIITSITAATAYGAIGPAASGGGAAGAGALPGNSDLRNFAQQLVDTLYDSSGGVLNGVGVSVDRDGRFTFDADAFRAAYQADPSAVQTAIAGTGGFADRVSQLATRISDPYDGTLSAIIASNQDEIDDYNDRIAAWDDRLAVKQASLQQIYSALEVQLSKLQAQSNWLSGQISSLDGLTSSSK